MKDFREVDPKYFYSLPDREISKEAAARFGVMSYPDPRHPEAHVYPYYSKEGEHIGNKVRLKTGKSFRVEGELKNSGLFGQSMFPKGGKILTIVEGECDAMAVWDMNEKIQPGSDYAVVSVKSASSAKKDVAENMEYVDSFDEIVVIFDRDEPKIDPENPTKVRFPGQEAAKAVASMFRLGKVRVCTLQKHKDPNDYLRAKDYKQFKKEFWQAPKFLPQGIKTGKELWDGIANPPNYETVSYPFTLLNHLTYGLRLSEFIVVTAPPKIGKTTFLKAIEYHLLKNTEHGVGLLHLEETNSDTALGLMSIGARKPLHLPDVRESVSLEEMKGYYDDIVNTDRVVIWDHFGSNTVDEVIKVLEHMAAMGCKYMVLDHLSIVVSDQSGDERKQLDELATKIKTTCMRLNIAVIAVIHQNAEGGIRGTKGIEQLANLVIRMERDKLNPDPWRRSITKLIVTENRFCGRTGPAGHLRYIEEEGVLVELDEDESKLFDNGGSPDEFE